MTRDLVALVADIQQEKVIDTLLRERRQALGIRSITFNIQRHPGKDPGVYHQGADLLKVTKAQYDHALVFIDCEWDGSPGDALQLRQHILRHLHTTGWPQDKCDVIAIEPELEAWVWAGSPHVPTTLRMTWDDMRAFGQRHGYWTEGQLKPQRPKDLLEAILKQQGRPRSSAIFVELAKRVGLRQCQDSAFKSLQRILQRWFPGEAD